MNAWMWKRTLSLVAGLLVGGTSPVLAQNDQPSDFAGRTQGLQVVAIQRFELAARNAITEADTLRRTSPAQAITRLREVQQQLDADTVLPPEKRRDLTRLLQDRIAMVRGTDRPTGTGEAVMPAKPGEHGPAATVKQFEEQQAVARQIAESLASIERLAGAGKLIDAEYQAQDLARKYPDAAPAQAMLNRSSLTIRLKDAKDLLIDYEKRIILAMRDIDKSALPAKDDVEFPKDWKEKSKRRVQETLTAKEKAIMRSLDAEVNLNYREVSFSEAIQDLSDRLGQPIILDKAAMADAAIDNTTPLTAKLSRVSARTALRKILSDMNLTYVIKNEVIYVTSTLRAKEMMVTRVYYIGDLIQATGPFGGAVTNGQWADNQQTAENLKGILSAIEGSIDPGSWKSSGGVGVVTFHAPTMSLIVRQTTEVHSMLQSKLGR